MSESGREALPDIRKWSGGPPGCPEVVERPFHMFGSGRESLQDFQVCLGGSPGCLGVVGSPSQVVGRPSQQSGSGR